MSDSHKEHSPGRLNRRRFLRGVGTAVALPALASLRPLRALGETVAGGEALSASAAAAGKVLRSVFVYFPNGAIQHAWWPGQQGEGEKLKLSRTLAPLEKVQSKLQILGGLDHVNAEAGSDGAGDHARGGGTFLTGVRVRKSATEIRSAESIDQVMAAAAGRGTRFPSLELSCEQTRNSGACDSGYACAYQYNLSWKTDRTPMSPESNPRQAFERLFGDGAPQERRANLQRRLQEERSVLDFVMEDARQLHKGLAAADRQKLDEYLTAVRELENRIERVEKWPDGKPPQDAAPAGIPREYGRHVDLMYDVIVLALQSDSTRVATLLLAHDGSNRPFEEIGISEGHHDLTHHRNQPEWIQKVAEIDRWYVGRFARFLERLEEVKEADGGTLLDNSMIVYGSGNSDGNRHTHTNLPVILAGGGGGTLHGGRYVRHGGKPMSNLFLSLADRMKTTGLERFGDSTGRLADL